MSTGAVAQIPTSLHAMLESSGLPITTGSSLRDAAQKIVELAK